MNEQLASRKEFFTENDIDKNDDGYYEGKILVLSKTRVIDGFIPKFQTPQNQLFLASGGFGCSPGKIGTAVIGDFLSDGERARLERYDFIGVLKKEVAHQLGYCTCGKALNECTTCEVK